jgi:hypothetical protein
MFVIGLLAALLTVPVLAAAVTDPATVQQGTTFNATDGPTVVLGEDANIDLSQPFPAADTVDLGVANVSGGNATSTLVGVESSDPRSVLSTQGLSNPNSVTLARTDAALSVTAVAGVDEIGLVSGAAVGDSLADIDVSTPAGSAGTVEIGGLPSRLDGLSATDTDTGDVVDSAPVTNNTATLQLAAGQNRTLALTVSVPEIVDGRPDGTQISAGDTVTLEADVQHQNFPGETVDVAFYELQTGDPTQDPLLGTDTLDDNGTATTGWTVNFGPQAQWYAVATDSAGRQGFSDGFTIQVAGGAVDLDISPNDQDILTGDSVVSPAPGSNPAVETDISVDWDTAAYSQLRVEVVDGNQTTQVSRTISSPQTLTELIDGISESLVSFIVRVNDTSTGEVVASSRSHTYYIPRIELRDLQGDPVAPNNNVSVAISDQNGQLRANRTLSDSGVLLAELLDDERRGSRTYEMEFTGTAGFADVDETHISDDWRAFPTQFIYLRNTSQLDSPFQVTFELVDRSGRFDSNQTALRLERQINGSWSTVVTGLFGANDRVTRALEENASYRVEVQNTQLDERREFGAYVPRIEGEFVQLEVGAIDLLPESPDPVVATNARLDADEQHIRWSMRWNETRATAAETQVTVRHPDNESLVLFEQTVFGVDNRTVTIPLTDAQADSDWLITWNISYTDPQSGEEITLDREQYLGGISDLGVPVSDQFLQIVSLLSLLLLAGLFGGQLATIGGVVVVGAAWLLRAVGFLAVPVEFLVAATVIAVLMRVGAADI